MKKENLPTSELLEMIDSFEHYPAVTGADDRGYILAYLDDEACSISQDEIKEYVDAIVVTKDNIHLYYEFMSDEDVYKYSHIIDEIITPRAVQLTKLFNSKYIDIMLTKYKNGADIIKNYYTRLTIFGVKDTIKPIEEYIVEIKCSNEYKFYAAKQLIGTSVTVSDNPETCMFVGNVIEVSKNDIDGILVSVLDQDDATWDIELKYIA